MQKATLKMIKRWIRTSAEGAAGESAHSSGGRHPDPGPLTDGDENLSRRRRLLVLVICSSSLFIPLGNTASSTGLLGAVGLRAGADVYMSLPTIRFKPSGLVIVMRRWPVRMKPRPRQLLNARVTVARDVPARPASSS